MVPSQFEMVLICSVSIWGKLEANRGNQIFLFLIRCEVFAPYVSHLALGNTSGDLPIPGEEWEKLVSQE